MIIWGSKAKTHETGTGQFFCPNCMSDTRCHHMRVSRYFTLYFIPLFPTSTLAQYVRCGHCHTEFSEAALKWSREELMQAMEPWSCTTCGNRNPRSHTSCIGCGSFHRASPPSLSGTSAQPQALPAA